MNTHSQIATKAPQPGGSSSARLETVRAAFGESVRLTEPFPGRPPLWIEPADPALRKDIAAAARWMAETKAVLEDALLTFGGIVWRGFPVKGPDQFAEFLGPFTPFSKGYVAGLTDRKTIKGKVMESTRSPENFNILLHQEMSYLPDNPRLIAFYCNRPAEQGGQTIIGDMRGLLEALPESLRRKFDRGAVYGRHFRNEDDKDDWRADPRYGHASWQYWFDTDDKQRLSAQLGERGITYQWLDDGSLKYWTKLPATTNHPATGELISFNQLYAQTPHRLCVGDGYIDMIASAYGTHTERPYFLSFGDGSPFTDADFMAIHEEMERRKVEFEWQAGDVMLLDNKLTGHGRTPFRGPRDVQVMLFE
jgi:alpha-ketoglutarate-dependent taurine dioxygenase